MKALILIPTILLSAALCLANAADDAKPGKGKGYSPAERLEKMKTELSLTDEQVGKVKPILEKGRESMMALREDKAATPEDRKAKMQELRRGEMEELKAILTPEQQEKAKAMMKERRGGKGGEKGDDKK